MNNAQKFSFQESLGKIAEQAADQAVNIFARPFPASIVSINGYIAKVKFEILSDYNLPIIEVPIIGSKYITLPLQSGDKGILIPCGASISAICGLGGNTADLTIPPNLASFVFLPIGNKDFEQVDSSTLVLTGISEIMLRNSQHQLKLEDEKLSWTNLVTQINALLLTIGAGLTTPTVLTPLNDLALNPVKVRT